MVVNVNLKGECSLLDFFGRSNGAGQLGRYALAMRCSWGIMMMIDWLRVILDHATIKYQYITCATLDDTQTLVCG